MAYVGNDLERLGTHYAPADSAPGGGGGGPAVGEELENAALKIQSVARGKAARERSQRIKMGEEDAFAEGGDRKSVV